MRANADPSRWHDVPLECALAIEEAADAHLATAGLFDPRVLDALVDLGYDQTMERDASGARRYPRTGDAGARHGAGEPHPALGRWRPRVHHGVNRHRVHLGGARIDLGGIGKGLAVRWAARELVGAGAGALVNAGGDCQLLGEGPSGSGWLVGMEDPRGGTEPLAVFRLRDVGCATSSVRLRRWVVDGREVHHIIDPRTGLSGGSELLSLTVVNVDVAWAEVWSKTLFLAGIDRIEEIAGKLDLAAAWVDRHGEVQLNPAARALVAWEPAHV